MIKATNLDAFDRAVQAWFNAVEQAAAEAAVGLARHAFQYIIKESPQYSGDFAANWRVGYGSPDTTFKANAVGGYSPNEVGKNTAAPSFQRGSEPAIRYAEGNAKWQRITLGTSIHISNSATHDQPYAWDIEKGTIKFRPVNEGASHLVRRAVGVTKFRFSNIGLAQLQVLRSIGS